MVYFLSNFIQPHRCFPLMSYCSDEQTLLMWAVCVARLTYFNNKNTLFSEVYVTVCVPSSNYTMKIPIAAPPQLLACEAHSDRW